MIKIKQILPIQDGEWYISYTAPHPCMCRDERFSITIKQKKQPTEKQILNEIEYQRKP